MLDVFNTFSYYVLSFLKRLARVSEFDNKVLLNQSKSRSKDKKVETKKIEVVHI